MPETKKRVYKGRGITRKLKAYIPETDNMMILCETSVCEAVVNRICHQFPQAAVYMAVTSQHMNTFDAMETIVHFLYHKDFRKHSSMLIVGGQQQAFCVLDFIKQNINKLVYIYVEIYINKLKKPYK